MYTPPFISEIKTNIIALFVENRIPFLPKVEEEINHYLKQSEEKLNKWHLLHKEGLLSLDEIEWLVISQRELLSLEILKVAGINQTKINSLQNNILKIILKTILIRI